MDKKSLVEGYQGRITAYSYVRSALENELIDCLKAVPHIDRIAFRVKSIDSFVDKVMVRKAGKYDYPFNQVEDQIAGRVIVFFETDINEVKNRLVSRFNAVETVNKEPDDIDKFGYQSLHLVINIPIQCKPRNWSEMIEMPETVEIQVRTLFMHAWAEPQHNMLYKVGRSYTDNEKKMIHWVAASAWGCDQAYSKIITS